MVGGRFPTRGCRWNWSLPGSRNYVPSERTTWEINERFRIDMIVCGGKSRNTFVFFADPTLIRTVEADPHPTVGAAF